MPVISWTEDIEIAVPAAAAWAAVADQHRVMGWSAWPAATGYTCAVEGDGTSSGSAIVFRDREGTEKGRQTITAVGENSVDNRLRNQGPGGRLVEPRVRFRVEPLDGRRCRVLLDFELQPPVPAVLRPVAALFLRRRIRPLHVSDLVNLKRELEASPAAA